MLILGRRADQSIVFPNSGIIVRVLQLTATAAKMGIDAPSHVPVLRGEICNNSAPYDSLSRFEMPPHRDAEQQLGWLTQQLNQVRSLREQGAESKAELLLESILMELNFKEAPNPSPWHDETVSDSIPNYDRTSQHRSGTESRVRLLYIGPTDTSEHQWERLESYFADLVIAPNVQRGRTELVASQVSESEFDCVLIDVDSAGTDIDSLLNTIRLTSWSDAAPCILCLSKYVPSVYGLSMLDDRFDGWICKPSSYETIANHLQSALGLSVPSHIA